MRAIVGLPSRPSSAQDLAVAAAQSQILPLAARPVGSSSVSGASGSLASTSLLVAGQAAAGMYEMCVYVVPTAAIGATLTFTAVFNDGRQAQSINVFSAISLVALTPVSARYTLHHAGGSAISYGTTAVGGPTYDIYVTLVRLS